MPPPSSKSRPSRQSDTGAWYADRDVYPLMPDDYEDDYSPEGPPRYGDRPGAGAGAYRKLRNIREQDEFYGGGGDGDDYDDRRLPKGRRGEGEGSSGYGLHRSRSCKEFQYPKSASYCFGVDAFEREATAAERSEPTSILKNRSQVPKSYSFSATTKTTPFDEMDYDMPPTLGSYRRDRQEAIRKAMSGYYQSWDEAVRAHVQEPHICCAREHCTSARCLFDDIYPMDRHCAWRRGTPMGMYGAGASGGSNRNLHAAAAAAAAAAATDWMDDGRNTSHRVATAPRYSLYHDRDRDRDRERDREWEQPLPPPPTMVCCCAADDYCYHRQQQHHMARQQLRQPRVYCPGHHPAAEEEEHSHCRAVPYDIDLEQYIRDERERLMSQDKFLDDDERYLAHAGPSIHYPSSSYMRRPYRSRSYFDAPAPSHHHPPPSRYDEDTCSESTEMDLEDFNIDLEKYWEELEKPPSPIDLDMQRRNMHSNLKVKNVNVGCYNNGKPIDMHDLEHEREMIKKSLFEVMPSPPPPPPPPQLPQLPPHLPPPVDVVDPHTANNARGFHFFEHAGSPLHHPYSYNGHKVYPAADTLPTYQYNNFYPEQTVQTRQPTVGGHHPSAGGHSALSLINNIFSIYKPNKYSPLNCQVNVDTKPEPCKKMNVPSTRRPLGAPHSEYMHSMKRPLIVSTEQPHFKIIPEKTGLKISPLYNYYDYGEKQQTRHKLTSTARPLMVLPH